MNKDQEGLTYINNKIKDVDAEIKALQFLLNYYKKYKQMWEELYQEINMPCSIEYMQNLEEKYLGDDKQ